MKGKFHGPNSTRKVLTGSVAVFAVAFCASFAASSIFAPTRSSDATNVVTANISRAQYYVNVNASDVTFNLNATPTGAMTAASTTVKTTTNAPTGYKLYIGMSDTDSAGQEKSAADKLKNGLYLDEDLSSTSTIAAAPGTGTTPIALTDNTWGYAVDAASTGAPTVWTNYTHTAVSSAEPTSDVYAAVPAVGSEELIQETTESNDTGIAEEDWADTDWNDPANYTTATVWYGARANMGLTSGAYANTVAYTAITQYGPTSSGDLSFSPMAYARNDRYEDATWDDILTVTSSLLVPTDTVLGDVTVTLTGGPEDGEYACSDPTATIVPMEEGANSGYVAITCTLPQAYAGDYEVEVEIPRYGVTYTGDYKYIVTWETISAMQEMTKDVCLSAGNVTADMNTKSNPVPEVFLSDIRGGGGHITGNNVDGYTYSAAQTGKYRVRKLADQHCWMTENMDLAMATTQIYHPYDTNVATNWSPTTDTITTAGATVPGDDVVDRSYRGNGSEGTFTVTTEDTIGTTGFAQETQGLGTYYSWGAAVAGQGATATGSVNVSICPKGWRLPTGGNATQNGSFAYLMNAYGYTRETGGSASARSYPMSYVKSGEYYWGNGELRLQGTNGLWWASTNIETDYKAYSFALGNNSIVPQYRELQKYYGISVRCLSE